MAEQSRRFVSLDKPIDKFIEDQKNNKTLSKTRRDVSLLTEFLNSKNESRRIEEILPKELNEYISEFIVAVRRKDGEDFGPSSFNRYLKACKYPCSVIEDSQSQARQALEARSLYLTLLYYMAESVFATRLVNLRSVTCYTDQNF